MAKNPSANDRLLVLRLRPDLVSVPVEIDGATTWVVKDPLTLEHFHFSSEEFALLEQLRHPVSLAEMAREFARQFSPRTIRESEVWAFLSRLHEAGLLMSDGLGQGDELLKRSRTERQRRWLMAWSQLTAIRFRGINPDAALTSICNRCGWLFSRATLAVAVAIVLFAAALVVSHFDEFRSRLPELSALADWRNVAGLIAAVCLVKVCHELGHALACKRLGGEVPEMGVLLLVFMPALYCDVSDAWRFNNKWQRVLVSAAGMLVEVLLAAIATVVWWYAQPGLVQLLALNVMIVCTVNTLLVNGNPLLRYDGYYILADVLGSPNLWQRSREALRNFAARWLLDEPTDDDALVPQRHRAWLVAYAAASTTYVALVFVGIVWGLVHLLYPYRLETLAYMLGLTLLAGALATPLRNAVRLVRNPLRMRDLPKRRLAKVATAGLVALVVILAWPVNYYVRAPLVILPADAARVYATVDGIIRSALPAGRKVAAHETIAQLENPEIEVELVRLSGERALAHTRLENLERLRGLDPEAAAKIPATRAALADVDQQLADRRRDARRLTLNAPTAGTVIAAPTSTPRDAGDGRLPRWSGDLLHAENRGALVEPGTLVCLVGDPARLTAVLLVDDTNVSRLAPGQRVRIRLAQAPGEILRGEVVDVARRDAEGAASTATAHADLAPLFAGLVPPGRDDVHYQVRVALDAPPHALAIGGRGEAKVAAERVTFARWLLRYVAQTFRLPT